MKVVSSVCVVIVLAGSILITVMLLSLAEVSSAKDWRGIVPLQSTRQDVTRLLGNPSDANSIRATYIFREAGDGFEIVRGKNFGHVAWESVRRVMERPRYFRFVLNKYESLIIPKRFLTHGSDEQVMRQIIVSHLGDKAKLLKSF